MQNTLALASTRLHTVDLILVAAYLLGITLFGLQFRKRSSGAPQDKSLKSYFLANNTIPWWAIALSIVSAETSTLTIISVPGLAFAGDFGFLQVAIGYMVGRIVVALLFLPRYFAGEMLTAYQLIDRRFGPALHKVTAGLFLLTRAAAEGVRVFAVSIVVGIAIGTRDILSIGIISLLTLLYTFEGGMAAVIWTDVVQMAIYVGGTIVAVITLGSHVSGGWPQIHTVAAAAGKLHMLHFALNLTQSYTFWAGLLGGTFLTMASHGTDQLMVQRLLAARNLRESQLALLSSGVIIFMQFAFFLLIGAGLYVFYNSPAQLALGSRPLALSTDRLFPTFIVREMPIGVAGLLIAAILAAAMSNLSAALNSLSSTTVVDFYIRLRPQADDRERNLISKASTVLWALVLFAVAVYSISAGGKGHVVEIGLSIASVAYGCLLGVFLLGTLTKFATEIGTTIGMVCGFVMNLWLWQGTFPKQIGSITIPHIAFTWYVLIGAIATFVIGALASLIFRKQSKRTAIATSSLLLFFGLPFPKGVCVSASAQSPGAPFMAKSYLAMSGVAQEPNQSTPNFTPVSTLINDAIAAHKLPGAVVVIGHNNKIVFEQAYGLRKLAGEPGLDGKPSPAEPMTEDTIFDMASLTKCLVTATAVMQLYEQGKITSFDDPVEKYLPDFNPQHEATRSQVTLRMLLTHTSSEAPDINLKDAWGLAAPDKAEGIHRALTQPLMSAPGATFRYSDINFILLGYLVEKLSGQSEDVYSEIHIFNPLGMHETTYRAIDAYCNPYQETRSYQSEETPLMCKELLPSTRIAPTAHDNEGTAATNPDFDHLLRGIVHDPTTRRMGGVAGHAGVFSTAHDISLFASALLEKLLHNTGPFPLKQSTLQLMTTAQQPGHSSGDITGEPSAQYPSRKDHHVRGFGWDIDSDFSRPRGALFPIGSFGHTGFTGTSLWMDPTSDTYVILLANAIHPRGNPPISHLRGDVATAAAKVLQNSEFDRLKFCCGLSTPAATPVGPSFAPSAKGGVSSEARTLSSTAPTDLSSRPEAASFAATAERPAVATTSNGNTLPGIDALELHSFAELTPYKHLGLLTNQTGLDSKGARTVDLLASTHKLSSIFSPEHGLFGKQDTTKMSAETDTATHLPITSLYGPHDTDKRPQHAQLADLDAVVIDLQDAGARFFTYETVLGYFLEAAAKEKRDFHHPLRIIVLDRPAMLGGLAVQGPVSDPGREDYTNYSPTPVRLGMTFGELARYDNALLESKDKNAANLTVIPLQGWSRAQFYSDTQLPWIQPQPQPPQHDRRHPLPRHRSSRVHQRLRRPRYRRPLRALRRPLAQRHHRRGRPHRPRDPRRHLRSHHHHRRRRLQPLPLPRPNHPRRPRPPCVPGTPGPRSPRLPRVGHRNPQRAAPSLPHAVHAGQSHQAGRQPIHSRRSEARRRPTRHRHHMATCPKSLQSQPRQSPPLLKPSTTLSSRTKVRGLVRTAVERPRQT